MNVNDHPLQLRHIASAKITQSLGHQATSNSQIFRASKERLCSIACINSGLILPVIGKPLSFSNFFDRTEWFLQFIEPSAYLQDHNLAYEVRFALLMYPRTSNGFICMRHRACNMS